MLSDDAYDIIFTIIHWEYDKIREWCTTKYKLKTTRGGYFYVDLKIKCLQLLSWWATDLTLRGKHIVLADFDATIMADFIDEDKLDYKDGKKYPNIEKSDKFLHSKWVAWEDMVYTYFTSMKNSRGVPITYGIRKTPSP